MINEYDILLLQQATKLYTLGLSIDRLRSELKGMVERGVPYDDSRRLKIS